VVFRTHFQVVSHFPFLPCDALIIHIISSIARKKIRKNPLVKTSSLSYWHTIWHKICCRLPFWQKPPPFCHFGSYPPFGGGFVLSFLLI
jgi:hypothetical protein